MTKHQTASICFIISCLVLCLISDSAGAYICLTSAIALFGFLMWLDRNKTDRIADLDQKINHLKERVDLQSLRNR